MDKKKNLLMFKFFSLLIIVFLLVFFIFKNGKVLLTCSNDLELNTVASEYLSFNYVNDNNLYKIDKENVMSDEKGKRISDNYFDFSVTSPSSEGDVSYNVILNGLGNDIDERFVKVYLTDQNNKVFNDFNGFVPIYNAFDDNSNGRVIYTGKITDKNVADKFRLRIWVSDKYKEQLKTDLVYEVIVEVK